MKKLIIMMLAVLAFAGISNGQTYVGVPFFEGWESSSFPAWTASSSTGFGLVDVVNTGTAHSGSWHLVMTVTTDNNNTTNAAFLHMDLTGEDSLNLEFWWKDIEDEDNPEDGIFFSDDDGSSFTKVHSLVPQSQANDTYTQVVLNLDSLATANGLALNNTFVIKFQQRDDDNLTGGGKDGMYFDDIFVYRRGASLDPGGIMVAGSDSVCSGTSFTLDLDETYGVHGGISGANYTYIWQKSTNLSSWTTIGESTSTDTSFTTSLTNSTYYRRGVKSDSGEGPVFTSPQLVYVDNGTNLATFTSDTSLCQGSAAVTMFGFPADANGVWSGGGMVSDNGDGTGTFNPFFAGPRTAYYTYTNDAGCVTVDSIVFNVVASPTASFSGLPTNTFTSSPPDPLSGVPSGGTFSGPGISDTTFYPSIAGTGSHNIIYIYSDPISGCTDTTLPQGVNVVDGSVESITGLAGSYCQDNSSVQALIGNPRSGWSAAGFVVYPATGALTQTSLTTANFVPSSASTNITYSVYFKFTQSTLTDSVLAQTIVHSLPSLSFNNLGTQYCKYDNDIALSGSYSTSTGSTGSITTGFSSTDPPAFSGADNNVFNPSDATGNSVTVTFAYTDANSCANSINRVVNLDTVPVVTITAQDTSLCGDAPFDTIVGRPFRATGWTAFFTGTSLFPVNSTYYDSVYFDPNNYPTVIPDSTYDIIYTYYDNNFCFAKDTVSILVNSLPNVSYVGLNTDVLCGDASPVVLTGNKAPDGLFTTGSASEDSAMGLLDNGDGTASLNPSFALKDSLHQIRYYYQDPVTGCDNDSIKPLTYSALPVLTLSGLDSVYCEDEDPDILTATTDQPNSGNTWYNGAGASKFNGSFTIGQFDPSSAGPGEWIINFEQINDDGCQVFVYDTTLVITIPTVNFGISGYCNNDSIYFTDSSFTNSNDSIIRYIWDYDNGTDLDTVQNGVAWYGFPNKYNFVLTVETVEGCVNSLAVLDTIGSLPEVSFEWDNICFEDTVQFSDSSFKALNEFIDPIVGWDWDFGDNDTSTLQHPTHVFDSLRSYDVKLVVTTNKNCTDSLVRTINIRPVIDTYPYEQTFQNGNGGWFANGELNASTASPLTDTSNWVFGVAQGSLFNDPDTSNVAYFTSQGTYERDEQSYVDGACFDFSSLQRPMIIFDMMTDFNEGVDGANLQYSIDNGLTWQNLGTINSGIEWYDNAAIGIQPGGSLQGWSSSGDSNWREARHSLDIVAGVSDVKLRFAFASDPNSVSLGEGFAFDNVRIEERSRLVLLEHFTNSSSNLAPTIDNYVDQLVDSNSLDVVDIQFHIAGTGTDPFYEDNQADASARGLFYGVFESGLGVLDGDQYNGISTGITEKAVLRRALADAYFEIDVEADINSDHSVNVTPTIKPRFNLPLMDLAVHIVVVEKEITSVTGINGDTQFQSVMKQMLTDAVGTQYVQAWDTSDVETLTRGWTFKDRLYSSNANAQSVLRAIVFIQDNETKEILQTAYTDSFLDATGIGEDLDNSSSFVVFPNPASNQAVVLFKDVLLKNEMMMNVYNQSGALMDVVKVYPGVNKVAVSTANYPNGLYHIQITDDEGRMLGTSRVSVQH